MKKKHSRRDRGSHGPKRAGSLSGEGEVRPIGARALKSLVDTLRFRLAGRRCLDLYAGQGRVGLALLEAGAEAVTFVERQRRLTDAIQRMADKHHWPATVITGDVEGFLDRTAGPHRSFDIVFADPPFPDWSPLLASRLFGKIARLGPELLVVKFPARLSSPEEPSFRLEREVPFGESRLLYYEREPAAGE